MAKHAKAFAFLLVVFMVAGIASPFMLGQQVKAATPPTISPSIDIVLACRVGNTARIAWSDLIAQNLKTIGIHCDRATVDKATLYYRALQAPANVRGRTWAGGGFDMACSGWAFGPDPQSNIYGLYHSSQFPPSGSNYVLWNDTTNDDLCVKIMGDINSTTLANDVWTWQSYFYQQLPVITLHYTDDIFPLAKNVNGDQIITCDYPRWPGVEQWKYDSSPTSSITLEQPSTGTPTSLSPFHSTWYYDLSDFGPIFGEYAGYGLMVRAPDMSMQPYMATGFTESLDGLHWLFNITHGIHFQNGEELDARDVVWTFRYDMTPAWGSAGYAYAVGFLGQNSSVYYPGEPGTAGAGEVPDLYAVQVDLPTVWGTFLADFGGTSIFPCSVLTNSSSGIPDLSTWTPNTADMGNFIHISFCTGDGSSYVYYGKNGTLLTGTTPIGAGPYKWVSYDALTDTAHLTMFNNYFRKAALQADGLFQITDYYIRGNTGGPTSAEADLELGNAQVLDTNFNWGSIVSSLNPAWSKYVYTPAYGCQELGFNMQHPILGTGLSTPIGEANRTLAAAGALHVRRAIEALIPKTAIINQMLGGFGSFGISTPVCPKSFGFASNITHREQPDLATAQAVAISELEAAGYVFIYPPGASFWDAYGLLITVVELAVIVVLAGFYFFRPRRM